jgi:putative spermidine/putrescine transport system permease protein
VSLADRKITLTKKLFLIFLLVIFTTPVVLLVIQSFAGQWSWPRLLPETWSSRAWVITASQWPPILRSIGTSLGYSAAATFLSLVLCITPAAAMVRGNLPNRTLTETLLMAPVMVPPITFTLGIHHVFINIGLADRWLGVVFILTAYSYPYMLRALMGGYEAMGDHYVITAANLGAGRLRRTLEIELPLLIPAIVSGGSIVFLVAFSDYYLVFLVGGGAVSGYSGYLFPFLTSSDRPVAALLTIVFLALPLLLFALVELTVSRWYKRRGMGG